MSIEMCASYWDLRLPYKETKLGAGPMNLAAVAKIRDGIYYGRVRT